MSNDKWKIISTKALDVPRRSSPKFPHNPENLDSEHREARVTPERVQCRMFVRGRNMALPSVAGRLFLGQTATSAPDKQFRPERWQANRAHQSLLKSHQTTPAS